MKKLFPSLLVLCSIFLFGYNINAQTADEKYFAQVDHYRYLLKEDKKAVRAIYEAQLIEADDYFGYEIEQAKGDAEKDRWKKAFEETRDIIYAVYKEELENLQNGFNTAMERLESNYKAAKKKSNLTEGRTKRG